MIKNISRLVLIAAMLFVAQFAFAATDDYVHYWNFDEGTGRSIGDARGGQNGTLVGSSTKLGWASGKAGTALFIDGGLGVGIALPNDMLKGSQGTISLWFKLEELSDRNILFSTKSTSDSNIYTALMIDREGRPQLQFRTTNAGADNRAQGTKILNKNEWYNFVLTATGLNYRMFINGEEVTVAGENTGKWFPEHSTHPLAYRMGALSDVGPLSGVMNGYIDEVKIYSRALALSEIASLYEEGNKATPTVPPAIRPALSITASEQSIPYGGSVILNWSSVNVSTCTATGAWNGPLATSGSQMALKLAADSTYGITCSGEGGSVQSSVTITVKPKEEASSMPSVATTSVGSAVTTMTASERQAKIDDIIRQIVVLIAELQKKIDELKASQS